VFSFLSAKLPGTAEFVPQSLNTVFGRAEKNYSNSRLPALEIASYAQRPSDQLLIDFGGSLRSHGLREPSFNQAWFGVSQKDQESVRLHKGHTAELIENSV
jgi:hypothetical protein